MSYAKKFSVGYLYKRADVQSIVGLKPSRGGDWATGYTRHNDTWFLFPTIGDSGRTGHDYPNQWLDDKLEWFAKNQKSIETPSLKHMTSDDSEVLLFTRSDSRDPFVYEGRVKAVKMIDEPTARIHWKVLDKDVFVSDPHELPMISEGSRRLVHVNSYERSRKARNQYLAHWGHSCQVCGMNFLDSYGAIGEFYIHVHHLIPLSQIGHEYIVDPINDLRPVCPNCHAMLHTSDPPLTITSLKEVFSKGIDNC